MFKEIKTVRYYYYCLNENRSELWKELIKLESKGETDTPDYHRTISAWATYDRVITLLEELIKNNPSLIENKEES